MLRLNHLFEYCIYTIINLMIKSIKHKGLSEFFFHGRTKGIQAHHAHKLRVLLTALNAAQQVKDLNVPAWHLHALKGDYKGYWSLRVNANWRITFIFKDKDVYLLDYQDYH